MEILDFSRIDTYMVSLLQGMVNYQLDTLHNLYKDDFITLEVKFNDLFDIFKSIAYHEELNLLDTYEKAEEYNRKIPIPPQELLSSHPLRFWTGFINYTNQVNSDNQHIFELFKDYVNNGDHPLNNEEKNTLSNRITEVEKISTRVTSEFNDRYRDLIKNSKILQEINASRKLG